MSVKVSTTHEQRHQTGGTGAKTLESCDWHVHSMFYPCPNGLYRRDYLWLAMATNRENRSRSDG